MLGAAGTGESSWTRGLPPLCHQDGWNQKTVHVQHCIVHRNHLSWIFPRPLELTFAISHAFHHHVVVCWLGYPRYRSLVSHQRSFSVSKDVKSNHMGGCCRTSRCARLALLTSFVFLVVPLHDTFHRTVCLNKTSYTIVLAACLH